MDISVNDHKKTAKHEASRQWLYEFKLKCEQKYIFKTEKVQEKPKLWHFSLLNRL